MTRPDRVFVEGATYHVYNRLARGERVFEGESIALRFRDLLRELARRDELTVLAWCLMPNHFHLAVRVATVPLDRPLRSLQQSLATSVNRRHRVSGPLWQGRYRAKLVLDERYLEQLLAYVHLNPVTAGLVEDPAAYRWSGHRELLGQEKEPIVAVEAVLTRFGRTSSEARSVYVRSLRGAREAPWMGEKPGHLPWWRLGRPPAGVAEDPDARMERARWQRALPPERPTLTATTFVERGARALGVAIDDLRSRFRTADLVRAREALAIVGVERYRLRVKDLAREMARAPDSVTKAISRVTRRRAREPELFAALDQLDAGIASGGPPHDENVGTA